MREVGSNKASLKTEKLYKVACIVHIIGSLLGLSSVATVLGLSVANSINNEKIDNLNESIYQSVEFKDYASEKLNYYHTLFENGEIDQKELIDKNSEIGNISDYIKETQREDHIEEFNKLEKRERDIKSAKKITNVGLITGLSLLVASELIERKAGDLYMKAKFRKNITEKEEGEGEKEDY